MKQKRRVRQPWWKGAGSTDKRGRRRGTQTKGGHSARQTLEVETRTSERTASADTIKNIEVPSILVPNKNHEGIGTFVHQVEDLRKPEMSEARIRGQTIEQADVAGLLVLSATIQWLNDEGKRQRSGRRWKVRATADYMDQEVANLFHDFGVFGFELTKRPSYIEGLGHRALKVKQGRDTEGKVAAHLVTVDLLNLMGRKAPDQIRLVNAIIEAVTNVREHAYEGGLLGQTWWMAAAYDKPNERVHVAVYDRGIGIPRSMRGKVKRKLLELSPTMMERITSSDGAAIEAAHRPGATRTKRRNRGRGLAWEMEGYIKGHPGIGQGTPGRYRVASGFGEYEVEHSTDGTIYSTYKDHRVKMAGTLVEWIIHIAPDEARSE